MKRELLEEALQEISDRHIEEAVGQENGARQENTAGQKGAVLGQRPRASRRIITLAAAAAALAVAVVLGIGLFGGSRASLTAYALGEAAYPEMAPYPEERKYIIKNLFDSDAFSGAFRAWRDDQTARWDQPQGYSDGAKAFAARSIRQFLSGADGENVAYSPVNVYLTLAMAAELTDGDGRGQLLDLLGADSAETLRTNASSIWKAYYCNDQATTCILANSLWLDKRIAIEPQTVDTLTGTYYASVYQGDMQSEKMSELLGQWLSNQTGGLLKEKASQLSLDPETMIALASTVYFREKWSDEFQPSYNEKGVFHGPVGDTDCEFMYQTMEREYFWADRFGAVCRTLKNGEVMWFILPDETVSVDEVLADGEFEQFLSDRGQWGKKKRVKIHFYLPKFDVSSSLDLTDGLKEMGITKIFEEGTAGGSTFPVGPEEVYFHKVQQAVRVAVDEKGVTAAAYTVMEGVGAAPPPTEEIDFRLDRPFIFVIQGNDGLTLFAGVVNQP